MPYAVTATGATVKDFDEIVADIKDAIRASPEFPEDVNLDEGPLADLINAHAEELAAIGEAELSILATFSSDNAEGVQQDDLYGVNGVVREAASRSTGTVTLGGTPTTPIPAGSKVRLPTIEGSDATIASATVIGGGGTVDAEFTADATGPIPYPDAVALQIVTPVAGWDTAVVNEPIQGAWALGSDEELDSAYRLREAISKATTSEGTNTGIAAAVRELPSVQFAILISNNSLSTDALGIPGKASRLVVYPSSADGDAIAAEMFKRWGLGPKSDGAIVKNVTDSEGNVYEMRYSIATEILLYVEVEVEAKGADYGGDTAVKDAVEAFGPIALNVGTDVDPVSIACYVQETVPGVIRPVCKIGIAPSPTSLDVFPVPLDSIALLDAARVTVTVAP